MRSNTALIIGLVLVALLLAGAIVAVYLMKLKMKTKEKFADSLDLSPKELNLFNDMKNGVIKKEAIAKLVESHVLTPKLMEKFLNKITVAYDKKEDDKIVATPPPPPPAPVEPPKPVVAAPTAPAPKPVASAAIPKPADAPVPPPPTNVKNTSAPVEAATPAPSADVAKVSKIEGFADREYATF
jgi:outer membrane biosynthesis protein TonB